MFRKYLLSILICLNLSAYAMGAQLPASDFRETRVLFIYNSDMLNEQTESDIQGEVNVAFDKLLNITANSNINNPPEFVYAGLEATDFFDGTVITEVNFGSIFYAQVTKDQQSAAEADITIFLTTEEGAPCGGLAIVKANAYNANIPMNIWCDSSWGIVLSHEIGHLYGARHPDAANTPYAYGHGLCYIDDLNPANNVATVMAVGYCPNGVVHEQFSSPDLIIAEGLPIVNPEDTYDVVRVIEERAYALATAYETKENSPGSGTSSGGCAYNASGSYDMLLMLLLACGIFYGRSAWSTRR